MTDTTEPRVFPIPFHTITMSERRLMATKFGVNWDAIEVELSELPRPADIDHPTDEEAIAAAKAFTRLVGPNERFALMFIAVKRELPAATEAEMLQRADAGEWAISFTADTEEDATGSPLPAPTSSTSSGTS